MKQKIICKNGMCIDLSDPNFMECDDLYDNIVDIIDCELAKEASAI